MFEVGRCCGNVAQGPVDRGERVVGVRVLGRDAAEE
jgi:hypothetical protein